jgi:hypothetical protein
MGTKSEHERKRESGHRNGHTLARSAAYPIDKAAEMANPKAGINPALKRL